MSNDLFDVFVEGNDEDVTQPVVGPSEEYIT
jgi:hypothetical protein